MKRFILLFIFISCSYSLSAQELQAPFFSEILAYGETDSLAPPPHGCVLFTGSSSIRLWKTLQSDFSSYCVINRGFGGAGIQDVIYYFDKVVTPYNPQAVVLYVGDNDLAGGMSPESVLSGFKTFQSLMEQRFPGTPVICLSAKPSPLRWHLEKQYTRFNRLLNKYCRKNKNWHYLDIFTVMLDELGNPVDSLFVEDKLHMSEKGYKIWHETLSPVLKELYSPEKIKTVNQ